MHEQLGQILDQKKKKRDQKTQLSLLKSLEQNKVLGAKAGYLDMAPCTHHRLRGRQTT